MPRGSLGTPAGIAGHRSPRRAGPPGPEHHTDTPTRDTAPRAPCSTFTLSLIQYGFVYCNDYACTVKRGVGTVDTTIHTDRPDERPSDVRRDVIVDPASLLSSCALWFPSCRCSGPAWEGKYYPIYIRSNGYFTLQYPPSVTSLSLTLSVSV
jgi:hypothetical protein